LIEDGGEYVPPQPERRNTMMKPIVLAAVISAFAASTAFAQDKKADTKAAKPPHPQQQRMADCNKEAGDRKADERKKFMSACLKEKKASADKAKKG